MKQRGANEKLCEFGFDEDLSAWAINAWLEILGKKKCSHVGNQLSPVDNSIDIQTNSDSLDLNVLTLEELSVLARDGNPNSMYLIGQMKFSGSDMLGALKWFEQAANYAHTSSKTAVRLITKFDNAKNTSLKRYKNGDTAALKIEIYEFADNILTLAALNKMMFDKFLPVVISLKNNKSEVCLVESSRLAVSYLRDKLKKEGFDAIVAVTDVNIRCPETHEIESEALCVYIFLGDEMTSRILKYNYTSIHDMVFTEADVELIDKTTAQYCSNIAVKKHYQQLVNCNEI